MTVFRKVLMTEQPELAKVNRKTNTLYLSKDIWNTLPAAEKNFVLLHEEGHLVLKTADEFKANEYAVNKFINSGTFTNKELGKKIMVMRSAFSKAEPSSNFTADVVAGASSGIMQTLSILGIGSKSRIKETQATAAANAQIIDAQATAAAKKSKSIQTTLLIVGALAIVGLVLYFTLKKR